MYKLLVLCIFGLGLISFIVLTPAKAMADISPYPNKILICENSGTEANQCNYGPPFIIILLINILVELAIGAAYLLRSSNKRLGLRKPLAAILLANIITYPLFYLFSINFVDFYFPDMIMLYILFIVVAEVIIILTEALIIFLINKKEMNYNKALILSTLTNIATIILGILLIFLQLTGRIL